MTGIPRHVFLLAAMIVLANLMIYTRTLGFDFVNYDDDKYVSANIVVQAGLNAQSLGWAFTHYVGSHYHPLTMLSHMLDSQIYHLNAGGHHLTNALLHTANALILFLFLVRLTRIVWPSALIAALFSLHPLRVESVAWIAERKDVLSAFFFLLSLWSYLRYTERPGWGRYGVLVASYAAGLLAKTMLVTLPFVLLLLDFWPLGRLRLSKTPERTGAPPGAGVSVFSNRVFEKLPLFGLAAIASCLTIAAQREGGALVAGGSLSPGTRLGNGCVAYVRYLAMTAWPRNLAVYYPYETSPDAGMVIGALAFLGAVTGLGVYFAKQRPAFIMGWLWYLGMLVPVIGIVQSGGQPYADRYTYLPSIGLMIALVYGLLVPQLTRLRVASPREGLPPGPTRGAGSPAAGSIRVQPVRHAPPEAPVARSARALSALYLSLGGAACLGLGAVSWQQTGYWRSSTTLFEHAVSVTQENGLAHYNLGCALANTGRSDEAIEHYRQAIRIRPDYPLALHNLGISLLGKGKVDEAIENLRRAVVADPEYGDAHLNLGVALAMHGKIEEAAAHLQTAVHLLPSDPVAFYNLGLAQEARGKGASAITSYQRAIELDPRYPAAREQFDRLKRRLAAAPAGR